MSLRARYERETAPLRGAVSRRGRWFAVRIGNGSPRLYPIRGDGACPKLSARRVRTRFVGTLWRTRGLVAIGLALAALAFVRPASAGPHRVGGGYGLSLVLPTGAHFTQRHFTPCADPVERLSVVDGRAILTIEERLEPESGPVRRGPFRVSGPPRPVECCSIAGRSGWVIDFLDHGQSFYAYLYPAGRSPAPLLHVLDSLRVESGPSA
jgi:hypothetical protein